jgi:hypothetical protein
VKVLSVRIVVLSAFLPLCSSAVAQVPNSTTNGGAVKDARGVSILSQMFQATGWGRQAGLKDAVLSGTLTRHFPDGDQTASFTMKLRGDDQYKYVEDGRTRLVAHGAAGAVIDPDGKSHKIPAQSALTARTLILPMTGALMDWNAAEVDVALIGDSSINSEDCVGVQLTPRYHDDADRFAATRKKAAPLTLWISSERGLVVRADYNRLAADNHTAALPETAFFSDYRNVHGVPIPFREDISLGKQQMYTYQFSEVEFNQGLADSDFNIAAILGGAQ